MSDRKLDKGFVRATTPDPLSLDGLIGWLKKQNPSTEYCYCDSRDCLLCRYFRAHGMDVVSLTLDGWRDSADRMNAYPYILARASNPPVPGGHSTYGAALKRALALRESL